MSFGLLQCFGHERLSIWTLNVWLAEGEHFEMYYAMVFAGCHCLVCVVRRVFGAGKPCFSRVNYRLSYCMVQ